MVTIDNTKTTAPDVSASAVSGGKIYARFDHSFIDTWVGEEREFSFRFAKPDKTAIKLFQKAAGRDTSNASRNMLVSHIHPDEKAAFLAAIDDYPGLITSYIGALMKGVGLADLGN